MVFYIIDLTDGITGLIDDYKSYIWNTQYYGQDDFEMTLVATEDNIEKLQIGTFIARDADKKSYPLTSYVEYYHIMVVQNIKIVFDSENGWLMTISGKGLKNGLLGKRIVWEQTNLSGYAIDGLRQIIQENATSSSDTARRIPNLEAPSSDHTTFPETIEMQLFGENLADLMESICKTYGYGWDIFFSTNSTVFSVKIYKGTDRTYDQSDVDPVIFSPDFNNLLTSTYEYNNANYRNAALIGGEGEGTSKRTTSVGTATGLDRYEAYIDGSSVSSNGEIITADTYLAMLQEYGQMVLDQTDDTKSFSGSIDAQSPFKINEDFYLGDIVHVENEKGIKANPRIIEIIYSEDDNGESVVPTFSEWEVVE